MSFSHNNFSSSTNRRPSLFFAIDYNSFDSAVLIISLPLHSRLRQGPTHNMAEGLVNFPPELIFAIVNLCDISDLPSIAGTCKYIHAVLTTNYKYMGRYQEARKWWMQTCHGSGHVICYQCPSNIEKLEALVANPKSAHFVKATTLNFGNLLRPSLRTESQTTEILHSRRMSQYADIMHSAITHKFDNLEHDAAKIARAFSQMPELRPLLVRYSPLDPTTSPPHHDSLLFQEHVQNLAGLIVLSKLPRLDELTLCDPSETKFGGYLQIVAKILGALPASLANLCRLSIFSKYKQGVLFPDMRFRELAPLRLLSNLRTLTIDGGLWEYDFTHSIELENAFPNVKVLHLGRCARNLYLQALSLSWPVHIDPLPWFMFPNVEELEIGLGISRIFGTRGNVWTHLSSSRKHDPVDLSSNLHHMQTHLSKSLKILRLSLPHYHPDYLNWCIEKIDFRGYSRLEHLALDFSILNPLESSKSETSILVHDYRRLQPEFTTMLPRSIKSLEIHHVPTDEDLKRFDPKQACRGLKGGKNLHYPNLQRITVWHEQPDYHKLSPAPSSTDAPKDVHQGKTRVSKLYQELKKQLGSTGVAIGIRNRKGEDGKHTKDALHRSNRLFWD